MISLPALDESQARQVEALRSGAGVMRLSDAVVRVRGSDRVEWLSGMVTNEVKSLAVGGSRYTAVVHEKGKILADGWVHVRADDVLLLLPAGTTDGVLEHFDRHVIMEDVEVARWPEASVIAVQGPRAGDVVPCDGVRVFAADRTGWGGVHVIDDGSADAAALGARLIDHVVCVGEEAWDAARLEAGIPRFGVDFDQENYVQEANITDRAVSFNKGCYVGQEVVCRLQMRGHVRRQLVPITLMGDPPVRGTKVGDVGVITSAARSDRTGGSVAIAMLKWDVASGAGTVTVDGREARIVPRPVAR